MLGQQSTRGTFSTVDSRIFVYEVTGLSQNEVTAQSQLPIRSSNSQFLQVPFHRMNEEMQRIVRLGGEIVNIRPLNASSRSVPASASRSVTGAESAAAEAE